MIMRFLVFLFLLCGNAGLLTAQQKSTYTNVEKRARDTPFWVNYNTKQLSHYLTKPFSTEEEKVRVIYFWIACHIRYDARRFRNQSVREQSPRQTLRRRKALCSQYAQLFTRMCQHAGISSIEIEGYVKGAWYETDDLFHHSDHAWNAVRIDGKWYLVDLTFASGYLAMKPTVEERILVALHQRPLTKSKLVFRRKLNDHYYKASPGVFLNDHLPVVKELQFIEQPITIADFENDTLNWAMKRPQNDSAENEILSGMIADEPLMHITMADSAFRFNCGNSIYQVSQYVYAAGMLLSASGKGSRLQQNIDLAKVQDAQKYADSARRLLPGVRELVIEQAYYKTQKNQERKAICKQYLLQVTEVNKKMGRASNIEKACIQNINSLAKQNLSLQQTMTAFGKSRIGHIAPMPVVIREKADSIITTNNEEIRLNADSVKACMALLNTSYHKIKDTLLGHLFINQEPMVLWQREITMLTAMSSEMRFELLDNKDEELKRINDVRYFFTDSIRLALLNRTHLRNSISFNHSRMMQMLGEINRLTLCNIELMKQSKRLGYYSQQQFDSAIQDITAALDSSITLNEILMLFTEEERKWGAEAFAEARKTAALIKDEYFKEKHRYLCRQRYIMGDRRKLMKICSNLSEKCSVIKSVTKARLNNT